jgi:ATP-dependent exoDNAse (exonuclease V) beta subunit
MPAPEPARSDQGARERVTGDLGTTFLLEAGAGTGKTKVLVDRYVQCVLDPDRGAGDVRLVAAVTFTEKAAGELRQRIREEFEARELAAEPGSSAAAAVRRALDGLDDASISTIHGFAGRLLREFPVEAGVDPAFEQMDELAAEIERARLWEEWLTTLAGAADAGGAAGAKRVRTWLARLLRAGVTLESVRELATGDKGVFKERYDIDPAGEPPAEPDLAATVAALAAPAARLGEFCLAACTDHSDKGRAAALGLVDACRTLLDDVPDDGDRLAAALFTLPAKDSAGAPGGDKRHWDAAQGGKDELVARYAALATPVFAAREAYATYVTGLAVAVADAFSRWAGAAQVAAGRLDFTDLLGKLRDLLADDRAARRAVQQRFRFILVDEFQDTDPLQAEIALLLCEREPLASDWRDIVLEPGKLFVVGDPKQSIYRFRRADITLYDQVKKVIAEQPGGTGRLEYLTRNFRTTGAVVEWVNGSFAPVFDDDAAEGRQPRYQALTADRPRTPGPRVAVLLGREYSTRGGETDAARTDEARALAALLVRLHGPDAARWQVQDRAAAREGGGEELRAPRWGDIALLFRATTDLETYEQALRAAGVPYRVEGGKTYFDRREVADALLCLRAVDDPSDGPALYGALHSSYFGFSDEDLVRFWAGDADTGGRHGAFDVFAARQPEGHEPIVAAMGVLRRLHERRAHCEAHELLDELVRLTCATEFLAGTGPGAAQAIANVDKLVDRARAFTQAGGGGLAEFLAWAAEAGDAAGEQESQIDDESDVVRLLTIHKAKGLEFPVVVLAGGALGGGGGGEGALVDRLERRVAIRLKVELPGAGSRLLEPAAYALLAEREKQMAASEMRRLLYVAATRARDRLVVSCFGRLRNKDGSAAAVLLGPLAGDLPAPDAAPPEGERLHGGLVVLPPPDPFGDEKAQARPLPVDAVAARAAWVSRRDALLAETSRPAPATSPSRLEQVDDDVRDETRPPLPGRARALTLGSAVHRVMELCDLGDETGLRGLAAAAAEEAGAPDLAEAVAALAGACWRSAPVRAAAASPEVYRELPVGVLVAGVVVNGAIDLLYRDDDQWVVVDYKTDAAPSPDVIRERYTPQGAAYALAVEEATGGVVREVVFVAAAGGGEAVVVRVDDELRKLAGAAVASAAREGRAIEGDEPPLSPGGALPGEASPGGGALPGGAPPDGALPGSAAPGALG